jgi:hypothetical protein
MEKSDETYQCLRRTEKVITDEAIIWNITVHYIVIAKLIISTLKED